MQEYAVLFYQANLLSFEQNKKYIASGGIPSFIQKVLYMGLFGGPDFQVVCLSPCYQRVVVFLGVCEELWQVFRPHSLLFPVLAYSCLFSAATLSPLTLAQISSLGILCNCRDLIRLRCNWNLGPQLAPSDHKPLPFSLKDLQGMATTTFCGPSSNQEFFLAPPAMFSRDRAQALVPHLSMNTVRMDKVQKDLDPRFPVLEWGGMQE